MLIGASTGGTAALEIILRDMPSDSPPIMIAQHMPPRFTMLFAERVNKLFAVSAREARDGDEPRPGLALVAPGGYDMTVARSGGRFAARLRKSPASPSPSADVLFFSAAEALGADAVGVILTGMGRDGAKGLLAMRRSGARTLGQDEATSVVYGMPRAAFAVGAVEKQIPIGGMAKAILSAVNTNPI